MIGPGFETTDPITRTRTVVVQGARKTSGRGWNAGSGVMVYRQTNDFGASTPEAVDEMLGAFATINGLAREGRVGKIGLPSNFLQLVATGRGYMKLGTFDAAMPIPLQLGLSVTFGRLAEALGYRAVYDRYLR